MLVFVFVLVVLVALVLVALALLVAVQAVGRAGIHSTRAAQQEGVNPVVVEDLNELCAIRIDFVGSPPFCVRDLMTGRLDKNNNYQSIKLEIRHQRT